MAPAVKPIPAAVKKDVLELLDQILAKLQPYQLTVDDKERKTLNSKAMGRESIPFVQEAMQLLANYPNVLGRNITDEMIAAFPTWVATYQDADDLLVKLQTIVSLLATIRLITGAQAMGVATEGYKDGQQDKGRTPGVKPIIDRMGLRFDRSADDVKPKEE